MVVWMAVTAVVQVLDSSVFLDGWPFCMNFQEKSWEQGAESVIFVISFFLVRLFYFCFNRKRHSNLWTLMTMMMWISHSLPCRWNRRWNRVGEKCRHRSYSNHPSHSCVIAAHHQNRLRDRSRYSRPSFYCDCFATIFSLIFFTNSYRATHLSSSSSLVPFDCSKNWINHQPSLTAAERLKFSAADISLECFFFVVPLRIELCWTSVNHGQ